MKQFGIANVLFVYAVFAEGFVLYRLYHWFGESIFHQSLTYFQLVGFNLLFSFLCSRYKKNITYKGEAIEVEIDYSSAITFPWVVLLYGYLLHLLIN